MKYEVKQFKLTNDDEIVCEVVEWPTEEEPSIVIRKAMKVISMENYREGARYYAFRPWLMFQDHKENLQILNSLHVVVEASPSKFLVDQYQKFCLELEKDEDPDKKSEDKIGIKDLDRATKTKVIKELQKDIKDLEKFLTEDNPEEKDSNNIIHFKPKLPTVH